MSVVVERAALGQQESWSLDPGVGGPGPAACGLHSCRPPIAERVCFSTGDPQANADTVQSWGPRTQPRGSHLVSTRRARVSKLAQPHPRLPGFVDKVLLEHSPNYSLLIVSGCSCDTRAGGQLQQRWRTAHNVLTVALYKKSLPAPGREGFEGEGRGGEGWRSSVWPSTGLVFPFLTLIRCYFVVKFERQSGEPGLCPGPRGVGSSALGPQFPRLHTHCSTSQSDSPHGCGADGAASRRRALLAGGVSRRGLQDRTLG